MCADNFTGMGEFLPIASVACGPYARSSASPPRGSTNARAPWMRAGMQFWRMPERSGPLQHSRLQAGHKQHAAPVQEDRTVAQAKADRTVEVCDADVKRNQCSTHFEHQGIRVELRLAACNVVVQHRLLCAVLVHQYVFGARLEAPVVFQIHINH